MKAHTSEFKNQIKTMGRELDSKITYTLNGVNVELGGEQLNSITPTYQGALLKSVMKELDIDSNVYIPEKTILNYQFGLKVNGKYEYINYGNYVVYKTEKQEDTNSYKLICYDKMLNTMIDYTPLDITYPINLREYINAIATKCGLEFANIVGTFANYDTPINKDNFSNGNYTFRDVLDYVAELVGGWFCINDDDKLEIRYPSQAKNYESDSGEEINFYTEVEDKIKELTIYGNSIQETRSGKNLLNNIASTTTIHGVTFTKNEDGSVICNGTATNTVNTYKIATTTLQPGTYTLSGCPSGGSTSTFRITELKGTPDDRGSGKTFTVSQETTYNWYIQIYKGNVCNNLIFKPMLRLSSITDDTYEPYGVSPSPDYPSEIESVGTYFSFDEETGKYGIEVKNTGKNLLNIPNGTYTDNGLTAVISNGIITINGTSTATSFLTIPINLELESNFSISLNNTAMGDSLSEIRLQISGSNFRSVSLSVANNKRENISIYGTYTSLLIRVSSGVTITNGIIKPQVELGDITTDYEPYQSSSSLFVLDQPLRSLPNGVKDIAYIKNNILYIDRYVGSVVLNGSETWYMDRPLTNTNRFYTAEILKDAKAKTGLCMSNYFVSAESVNNINTLDEERIFILNTTQPTIRMNNVTANTLINFKNWLSTHNTQVYYELAEPYTETIGEVEIPRTFKGNNNITLSANINTNIDITYTKEYEEVDREFLKDVNVSFSKKYGPVNSVVFSRGGGSDNIYRKDYDSISANGLTEIKITDNPFLEDDERENFIQSVFDKLNGLEFYIMDVASTGITYLELGDLYYFNMSEDKPSLKAGLVQAGLRKAQGSSLGKYICLMLNDKIDITQGLSESIYVDEPDITETDYKTASITDKSIKNAIIQTNKNSAEILLKVNSDEVVSAINLSPEKIKIQSSKIDVEGVLSVLGKAGSTVINGANITTGSINCDRLNGGTINGQAIRGGSISITTGNYYFNMGTSTSNPNCSGLNVGNYGIKAYSDITATGFAITDSDTGKSESFGIKDYHGHVHYLTFTGGILTKWEYK